ncbi:KAP family P-loop NTPase fold protein [Methylobacillus sp.]|uniref:KAP family P-loop NTPase fold protein n=1 Tax=Methylobacillus sp. TaxID=56818 RepID=UPI002FE1F83F
MDQTKLTIDMDHPLVAGKALAHDKLNRSGFAASIVHALQKISSNSGFVVSVEGTWGSGKTSTLAMIEELLNKQSTAPVIVNFNPWLIGDRNALLRLFLGKIATAVKLTDHTKNGRKAAKELKSYAKAFDVIKLIPGAEPWASIVKSVVSSVGEATGDIFDLKSPDIESQKIRVEEALHKFPHPIIVFIDDIDRLFPQEVVEMIRIIKAVGDLPNVGYVLAWDAKYVQNALASASIPQSDTYLDKIVQVRMPLPCLSISAKESLINEALEALPDDVLKTYFPSNEDRLSLLYFSGLRELLEQPRDVARLFNTLALIEPALRGEIVFADILGLAAVMVKGTTVFELLQKSPHNFVGRFPKDSGIEKSEDILKNGQEPRKTAYQQCSNPDAIRKLIHFLFPQVAQIEDEFSIGQVSEIDGHLAAPARLLVALQRNLSANDVSFISARKYLLSPDARPDISKALTVNNCLEFLESLGDMAKVITDLGMVDIEEISLSITRLVDQEPFLSRTKALGRFTLSPEMVAENSVKQLIVAVDNKKETIVSSIIVQDPKSLTVAAEIVANHYLRTRERSRDQLLLPTSDNDKDALTRQWAHNILVAAQENWLLKTCTPGFILWTLARLLPQACPAVFQAIRDNEPSLDSFAMEILGSRFDSHKGQAYVLPKDLAVLEAYSSMDMLRAHAERRLLDHELAYPAKAAWRAMLENKSIYGKDGSICER